MVKRMFITVDDEQSRVAIVEDGSLAEIYIERNDSPSLVGNIYLGQVKDVLPGMGAAFVDIGRERNAFLYLDEALPFEAELDTSAPKIEQILKRGQTILVQVTKDPLGSKGARLTTQVSLPARHLVLLPFADFVGTSRRLEDKERERIRLLLERIKPEAMGLIARTASQEAELEDFEKEKQSLLALWQEIQEKAKSSRAPQIIHQELDLPLRMVRDVFSSEFNSLIIDSREKYQEICQYLNQSNSGLKRRVRLYQRELPIFEKYHINSQIEQALKRKIWLRSGGFIVIDQTEALTAIDVNTGKYVGKRNLQETILKTNVEAASEIARQIRLRDIGGLIVIDFIGMTEPGNQEKVLKALQSVLARDRTKMSAPEFTRLGLVEFTRKNVSAGLLDLLGQPCPYCRGQGKIIPSESITSNE